MTESIEGEIIWDGIGAVAFFGEAARLFQGINLDVKRLADAHSATEAFLPSLISEERMHRTGHLERSSEMLFSLRPFVSTSGKGTPLCSSAVCLNAYPRFEGKTFRAGQSECLTCLGRAYRRETGEGGDMRRLAEFNMREIIFFGSKDFVAASLRKCIDWMNELVSDCDLEGKVEPAHDTFFSPDAETLVKYQLVNQSKFELRIKGPRQKESMAVASVNNHGGHFSKAYDIRFDDGQFIHTGCFGLGLERLIFALVDRHGSDLSRWPRDLRSRYGLL